MGTDFALARYDAEGELDPSFGTGGRVLTDMGSQGRDEEVQAVALQSDGKIVVAGLTGRLSVPPNATDFALARYNPNGTLDTSFDGDGRFTLDLGGTEEFASDLAVQSDGKVVVAGTVTGVGGGGSRDFALIRLNPNGSLDTTFDTDGIVTTDILSSGDDASAVAVQADGKIVAGGSAGTNFALARYNANGALDTTFDNDGIIVDTGVNGTVQGLGLQQGGKIVAAGGSDSDFAVARYIGDTGAPRVTRVAPAEDATGIAPAADVVVSFSEAMAPVSISTGTVKLFEVGNTTAIRASVSYDAATRRATLDPDANLKPGKKYRAVVTTGARDLAGNALDQAPAAEGNQPKAWFFTVRN